MVEEYNSTQGAERGTQVRLIQKNTEDIDKSLNSKMESFLGAKEYPQISFISSETANKAVSYNLLVCAEDYLSKAQLSQYFAGFINEGRFTGNDKTYIFPITKKLDITIINESEWNMFYRGRDVSPEDWNTWNGLRKLGEKYYNWSNGKALLAFENLENFIFTYSAQKLPVLVQAGNNEIKINARKNVLQDIWNIYFGGVIRGYISQNNDIDAAMENREIIAYIGEPCDRNELPSQYVNENGTKSTMSITSSMYPVVNDSRNIVPQLGQGVAVFNHGEEINLESYYFLNWLCTNKSMIEFSFEESEVASCKSIYDTDYYEEFINEMYLEDNANTLMISTSVEQITNGSSYGSAQFVGFGEFSKAIESTLIDLSAQGRQKVEELISKGMSYSNAVNTVDSDAAFEEWYNIVVDICRKY